MKHITIILAFLMTLSNQAVSDTIDLTVPSAVANRIDVYRAECAEDGGQIELDGDELSKLWTDEGEEAYVIYAAFTCSGQGHTWCGATGNCPTQLVVGNKVYETNRILSSPPNRISRTKDGIITYWIPEGLKFVISR